MKSALWLLGVVCLTLLPSLTLAAIPTDLVPCGDANQQACQTCHVYALVENVFDWIFGVSAIIVTIIILVGGIRIVTAGGNQQTMRSARKFVGTAIVGFILIGSSWVLVDLLIATLSGETSARGIFSSIQCVDQPLQPATP